MARTALHIQRPQLHYHTETVHLMHLYARQEGGSLTHWTEAPQYHTTARGRCHLDWSVGPELIELMGWPTSHARPILVGGYPTHTLIGVDEAGDVVEARAPSKPSPLAQHMRRLRGTGGAR